MSATASWRCGRPTAQRVLRPGAEARYEVIEDRDEYRADNIFWVPKAARWSALQASARRPESGRLLDDAMVAIEQENPSLKGVLSKDYARPQLDKRVLES
jgi:type I restriction enzyme M protein